MLVVAGSILPGLGNQYAAIGAWDTQLAKEAIRSDRADNLRRPADQDRDHGSHGAFDDQAGGFLDPAFLRTLPVTVKTFAAAAANTVRDRKRRR